MPSLKDLKIRINSVRSNQKITSAMKMVAAAKLRRAQEQAEAARPYAENMGRILTSLAGGLKDVATGPRLLTGTGEDRTHLLVVMTSDRGLCGGFNSSIARAARRWVREREAEGKTVMLLCVGRKGRDQLRRDFGKSILETIEDIGKPRLTYKAAEMLGEKLARYFDAGQFDRCTIVYNRFKSAISQIVTFQQLIPFGGEDEGPAKAGTGLSDSQADAASIYEYEPDQEEILTRLLPRNLGVQIYRALLESAASEQGARMSAMDNATRNAGDMIARLTLNYNRTRQAAITKELIEIISGAEAV